MGAFLLRKEIRLADFQRTAFDAPLKVGLVVDGVHDQPRQHLCGQGLATLGNIPVFDPLDLALSDNGSRLVWSHPQGKRVLFQPHALVGLAGVVWARLVDAASVL